MNRRQFLGWLGGAVVAAATPDAFRLVQSRRQLSSPASRGAKLVSLHVVNGNHPGTVDIFRVLVRQHLVMESAVAGGLSLTWQCGAPEFGIWLPDGVPTLEIEGPVFSWSALARTEDGKYACSLSGANICSLERL